MHTLAVASCYDIAQSHTQPTCIMYLFYAHALRLSARYALMSCMQRSVNAGALTPMATWILGLDCHSLCSIQFVLVTAQLHGSAAESFLLQVCMHAPSNPCVTFCMLVAGSMLVSTGQCRTVNESFASEGSLCAHDGWALLPLE
jgi:hypothetical protein